MKAPQKVIFSVAAAAALATVIVGGTVAAQAGGNVASSNPLHTPVTEPAGSLPTIVPSAAAAERTENFPPLEPADAGTPLLDPSLLTNAALSLANAEPYDKPLQDLPAEEKRKFPIFAVQTTFGQLGAFDPGLSEDAMIDSERPIWAMTVHAKVENDVPAGFDSQTWDVYTAVFDAVSGDMISSGAGVDLNPWVRKAQLRQ